MGARHEEAALVAGLEFPLDPRQPANGGRRDQKRPWPGGRRWPCGRRPAPPGRPPRRPRPGRHRPRPGTDSGPASSAGQRRCWPRSSPMCRRGSPSTAWCCRRRRERAGFTRSRRMGLSSIRVSMRWRELRLAISTVGCTASTGPGAWWMMKPRKLLPASVAPTCAPFMNTTRRQGCDGDRQSMISRKYGRAGRAVAARLGGGAARQNPVPVCPIPTPSAADRAAGRPAKPGAGCPIPGSPGCHRKFGSRAASSPR